MWLSRGKVKGNGGCSVAILEMRNNLLWIMMLLVWPFQELQPYALIKLLTCGSPGPTTAAPLWLFHWNTWSCWEVKDPALDVLEVYCWGLWHSVDAARQHSLCERCKLVDCNRFSLSLKSQNWLLSLQLAPVVFSGVKCGLSFLHWKGHSLQEHD